MYSVIDNLRAVHLALILEIALIGPVDVVDNGQPAGLSDGKQPTREEGRVKADDDGCE